MLALLSLLEILYKHSNLKDFPRERSGQEAELWTGGLYCIVYGKIRMYQKPLDQSLHNWHRFWIMDLVSMQRRKEMNKVFALHSLFSNKPVLIAVYALVDNCQNPIIIVGLGGGIALIRRRMKCYLSTF